MDTSVSLNQDAPSAGEEYERSQMDAACYKLTYTESSSSEPILVSDSTPHSVPVSMPCVIEIQMPVSSERTVVTPEPERSSNYGNISKCPSSKSETCTKSSPFLDNILQRARELCRMEESVSNDSEKQNCLFLKQHTTDASSLCTQNDVTDANGDAINSVLTSRKGFGSTPGCIAADQPVADGTVIVKTVDFDSVNNSTPGRDSPDFSSMDPVSTPGGITNCSKTPTQSSTVSSALEASNSSQAGQEVSAHASQQDGPRPNYGGDRQAQNLDTDNCRPMRKRGKRQCADVMTCPVCHARVAYDKAEIHLQNETTRLHKWLQSYIKKSEKRMSLEPAVGTGSEAKDRECDKAVRYQTYQRVKRNRQLRGPVKRSRPEGVDCPVCSKHLEGTQEQINEHVNLCLSKTDDDTEVDVVGSDDVSEDGSYEEYEWAGQKRVRVTSMAGGNLATMGYQVARREESGSDEELDIEEDHTQIYGAAQYSEADLIPCRADEPSEEKQRRALRRALLTNTASSSISQPGSSKQLLGNGRLESTQSSSQSRDASLANGGDDEPITEARNPAANGSLSNGVGHDESEASDHVTGAEQNKQTSTCHSSSSGVVHSLKQKIRDLEATLERSSNFRCLICMESYVNAVTSVQCWHVHCEDCWLRTLGVKKLCPQCNMITHPADLRKIYL